VKRVLKWILRPLLSRYFRPHGVLAPLTGRRMARRNMDDQRVAQDAVELGPGDRFLDIACGAGPGLAIAAGRAGPALAVGIDKEPAQVRLGSRINPSRYVLADVEALPFRDGAFTVASSVNGLLYWPIRERPYAEVARVLAAGGRFVATGRAPRAHARLRRLGVPSGNERAVCDALENAGFVTTRTVRTTVRDREILIVTAERSQT